MISLRPCLTIACLTISCLTLFLPLSGAGAAAQTPDTATLTGVVQDATHAAVAGATVTLTNQLTGLRRFTHASAQGRFFLSGLPVAGEYNLEAGQSGFAIARLQHIRLTGGSTASLSLTLSVSPASTSVTIKGDANQVRIDEPQLGDRLGESEMDQTPLLNRRITYLPLLDAANRPAINQGDLFMNQDLFTTNGAGRRQTWFEVDGGNAIDSWGRQTIFTNIPLDAVAEMTVLTNSFSAEYGDGAGSVVNIVTRSGGDHLHGSVLELYRPSGPEAKLAGFNASNATSGTEITNDTLDQTAVSLSGRLLRHSPTYFFAAGEFSQQNRASPVTSPLAPGNFVGHYQDVMGFLRLDHQFSPRHNAFFRSSDDAFYDTNPAGTVGGDSLPTVARTFHRRTYTQEIGDTAVLSPAVVNNLRLQFELGSPITQFVPAIDSTQFVVPIAGQQTFTSGTSQSALLLNHQFSFNDTVAAALGNQQITFGASIIYARSGGDSKEFGGPIYLGSFTFNTCSLPGATPAQAEAYCESPAYLDNIANVASYTQSYGNANYLVNDVQYALFVQDDDRISPRLVLNYGLRYFGQTFTNTHNGFAPRVGFDADLFGNGHTVVRGGFGIYYSQVVDNEEADYALTGPTGVFNYNAAPGQVGFPSSVSAAPLPAFPSGAVAPLRSLYIRPGESSYLNQFFPTSTLIGYPSALLNPYTEQYTLSLGQQLSARTLLSVDYLGAYTVHIYRPLDVDPPTTFNRTSNAQIRSAQAANCTRPYWVWWYQQNGMTCNPNQVSNPEPPYSVIQSDVNDGYLHYNALDVNLREDFGQKGIMLVSYTWSHTLDNVDPDATSQNPNNPLFVNQAEYGNALYDQRNRFVASGYYTAPFQIRFGGILTLAGGLPYNLVTGVNNSGDIGATTDRPIIHGVLVGRDTGRGTPLYYLDPFLARDFRVLDRLDLNLRAEAFNVLNHANFASFNGTYGTGNTAPPTLGSPVYGIASQFPAREFQFSARISF
ncbi:MAG: carboxypeptidase regulatory-like domain-containing protein [Acidobacteriota bacterium]